MQSRILFAILAGGTFILSACGSESGADAPNTSVLSEVETSLELGNCTNELNGISVYVTQENVNYICLNGYWIKKESAGSSSLRETYSSSYHLSSSSSSSVIENVSSFDEGTSSQMNSSSSSVDISSSSSFNNNQTLYGTFVDERDGKTYKYVTIRNQTWMAENLNYADSVKNPMLADGYSWCINHKDAYCELFGRFYTWQAAVDSLNSGCGMGVDCSSKVIQGICPAGWHIPTYSDIATLIKSVGGTRTACKTLKSKYWWHDDKNGSDAYGFNFLPAGWSRIDHKDSVKTVNITGEGNFWGMDSTEKYAYRMNCHWKNEGTDYGINVHMLYGDTWKHPYEGMNVRCVKDSVDLSQSTRSKENLDIVVQKETFTDKRDGKTYKYVTIGSQKWMAEGLRFDAGKGKYYGSYIYFSNDYPLGIRLYDTLTYEWFGCQRDSSNCWYRYSAAMDSMKTLCGNGRLCKEGTSDKGICPDGWRLPSREDFEELINYIGGEDIAGFLLRSMKVWTDDSWDVSYNYGGIDLYGFSADPREYGISFMTSEEIDKTQYYVYTMELKSDDIHLEERDKSSSATVRCIMNTK